MKSEVGARLAIMKYETTAPLTANRAGFTPEVFDALGAQRSLPPHSLPGSDSSSRVSNLVNSFIAEIFTQIVPTGEPWRYRLPAAVSEVLLGHAPTLIDGLIYPTVAMSANEDNLALRPDFAKTKLRPVYAKYIEISAVSPTSVTYSTLDEARRFDVVDTIHWLGHEGEWVFKNVGDELTVTFVGAGRYWEARNAAGEVVEPT
jgi:hypothetical protein